jgi:ribonuclease VapC
MIVVDTSALFAILINEPEASVFMRVISDDDAPKISALTLFEAMILCHARGRDPLLSDLKQLLTAGNVQTVPFDQNAAEAAHQGYLHYGKGYHPARLNLADCAAYSLAIKLGCPLLFKGDDFKQTGITPAVPVAVASSGPSSPPTAPKP